MVKARAHQIDTGSPTRRPSGWHWPNATTKEPSSEFAQSVEGMRDHTTFQLGHRHVGTLNPVRTAQTLLNFRTSLCTAPDICALWQQADGSRLHLMTSCALPVAVSLLGTMDVVLPELEGTYQRGRFDQLFAYRIEL
ncbi:hypothetical protein M8818_007077 [Zalaria obscura]|uniref:Uncharacterized protein n=1 Tax=Zalaria obscura TaxID=2024903 RepID=A0ACC3S5U2_9PEZI